jgi:uncharacterized membrane protein YqjE
MEGAAAVSKTNTGGRKPVDVDAPRRSRGELTSEVTGHLSHLVSLQLELARTELAADVRRVVQGTALVITAALVAHLILILASMTIAFALIAFGLPGWLAFLIVTLVYTLVAVILGIVGVRSYKKIRGMPRSKETFDKTKAVLRREHTAQQ